MVRSGAASSSMRSHHSPAERAGPPELMALFLSELFRRDFLSSPAESGGLNSLGLLLSLPLSLSLSFLWISSSKLFYRQYCCHKRLFQ